MAFSKHRYGAYSKLTNSLGLTGTLATVQTGDGAHFVVGADAIMRAVGTILPLEIARVTGSAKDTLTITRAQGGLAALQVTAGWEIFQSITAASFTEIEPIRVDPPLNGGPSQIAGPSNWVNVKDYGAVGDTKRLSDGAISGGTTTFTSGTAGFTAGDVGKLIWIARAGSGSAYLSTTIQAFVNATTVTLATSSGATVSGASFGYGTDDTAALASALATIPATGGTCFIPSGTYLTTAALTGSQNNVEIVGQGWSSVLLIAPNRSGGLAGNHIYINSVSGWNIHDLAFDGNRAFNVTNVNLNSFHAVYSRVADHITFARCKITQTVRNGIFLERSCSYYRIEDNLIDGGDLYNGGDTSGSEGGIACGAHHSTIRGNQVQKWWKQLYVFASDCLIEGNRLIASTAVGVQTNDANTIEVYQPPAGPYQGRWLGATTYSVGQSVSYQDLYWLCAVNNTGSAPSQTNANWTLQDLAYRAIVRGNICENVWTSGIQVGVGSARTIVDGNTFRSFGLVGTPGSSNFGVLVNDPSIIVTDNQIDGFRVGIYTYNYNVGAVSQSPNVTIAQNNIGTPFLPGAAGTGVYLGDVDANVANNTFRATQIRSDTASRPSIHGNYFSNVPSDAIILLNCLEPSIVGNVIDTTLAGQGIFVFAGSTRAKIVGNAVRAAAGIGIACNNVNDGVVSDNTVTDCGNNGINFNQCLRMVVTGNVSTDTRAGGARTQPEGISFDDQGVNNASDSHVVVGNSAPNNVNFSLKFRQTGTSHTHNRVAQNQGYNPVGVLGPPAVPASTTPQTNTYGVDATVYVAGGTVTAIAIGGTATGATSGAFRVASGQTIAITYTVAPTWVWIGD